MTKFKTIFLENVIFTVGDLLYGTEVSRQLRIHRSYTSLPAESLQSLQTKKLTSLLKYATSHCPAYRQYASDKKDPFACLQQFPIITKSVVNSKTDEFLSSDFDKSRLIKYETSGSSGIRAVVYVDKKEQSICRAILINWWEWNGYYLGKPMVQTGMTLDRNGLKKWKDRFLSTQYVNAYGLTEDEILRELKKVEWKKGFHLFGYSSSLYVMAQIAKKNGLNVKFDKVLSQGDKLFRHYKTLIEEVFQTTVVEDYGLNEGIMIGQKKDLPYFYIYTPSVHVEIVDEEGIVVPDGTMGRIIATKLDGYAMPLIRYDTGDLGIILPKEEYPEKRDLAFPLLKSVIGRNTDIIKAPEGNSLIVHTFTGIFEFFEGINQFQVVQDEMDCITIRFIKSDKYAPEILMQIEQKLREKTQSNIEIIWEEVEYIAPSKSGKPQLIVNNTIKNSLSNTLN